LERILKKGLSFLSFRLGWVGLYRQLTVPAADKKADFPEYIRQFEVFSKRPGG